MNDPGGQQGSPGGLTPFQREVAAAFFSLPQSRGFLLAGGAALVALGVVDRPTRDLDLFTTVDVGVAHAATAFTAEAGALGWQVEVVRESGTFTRLVVARGGERLLVDLAVDLAPTRPPVVSDAGPVFDTVELGAPQAVGAVRPRRGARLRRRVYPRATARP